MSGICTATGVGERGVGGGEPAIEDRAANADRNGPWPFAASARTSITARHVELAAGVELMLPADGAAVVLAIPLDGGAQVEIGGTRFMADGRQAVLNAQDDATRIVCPGGGAMLIIGFRRSTIQMHASAAHGEARRLGRASFLLQIDRAPYMALLAGADLHAARVDAACEHMVAALATQHGIDDAFTASRSISLARRRLDADPTRAWDLDDLARGAGVTPITLQRGFRDYLGTTVAGYAQAIRLRKARACLASERDSRSITAIAQAAGFARGASFVRAYQRLFGETPTQTRSNAVRFDRSSHMNHR